jgi:tight adherence protein C
MPSQIVVTLVFVFVSAALLAGGVTSLAISRSEAGRRRLAALVQLRTSSAFVMKEAQLTDPENPFWDRLVGILPTSRGSVKRLRRDVALAGFQARYAPAVVSIAELVCPVLLAAPPFFLMTGLDRWIMGGLGAVLGYMLPGVYLSRRVRQRKKEIQNGLADALDLLVLCLEAGSGLDQAIVKASEELGMSYPALGDQLRIVISEMRAGKGRLEAFRGLAERTQVDDVRALVAMLVQTDRFGTSISQALRTHAEVCRTKRRQRAEERAHKVGVKLVFPLVFCLFPALYVVMLGPAFIKFSHLFETK